MLSIILDPEYHKKELVECLDRSGYEYRLVYGPKSDLQADIFKTVQLAMRPSQKTGAPVKSIINLYDECDARGQVLTEILDAHHVPTTCAVGPLYDITRVELKAVCGRTGAITPLHFFYNLSDSVESISSRLKDMKAHGVETIFIKPGRGYNSVGITKNSKQSIMMNDEAAWISIVKMIQEMGETFGSTLVEEFIDGKEISILIMPPLHFGEEPIVFKPIEFNFKKSSLTTNFLTGEDKLDYSDNLYWYDDSIYSGLGYEKAMNYVKKIYQEFGFKTYVRFDVRVRETKQEGANEPSVECYVVDCNPGCSIFAPCTAVSILKANGKDNDWFLNHIIESSVNLKNKK